MVKQVGQTDKFALDWSRKNRRIAFVHHKEITEVKEMPIVDTLKKKKQ